ncbi:MAG: entericidin A/B family lipoprotein [Rhodoferax sp.]|nr:entericidin A/B family lipoprotein [Betaproteobacteria bacterium]NCN97274.1 entericidin A/B family lipoprotein [Rhodoferax sp.]OIP19256.1 MAG: entericidin [Comamonadaceae bacterium CG2_30_57_122]PIZ23734.1 MAG: entericidin [Comamonadaceae bacterium CG_4_10_14_0_8_um_filter_57_29]PJC14851.1 MAG: entericidin [Comamonadaceae bacterium CG_4_9_14_0_8_um_filter_57_21]HBB40608.1 entericidin [Pseudomonadota bacterium]
MKSLLIGLLSIAVIALTGCNTVKGMGQDIQKAGSAIEGAGKKN